MAEICGPRKRKRHAKLTMEEYLDFLHAEKRPNLTFEHLNQIIFMHGFRKFNRSHRASKGVLVEAVSKMELVDPTRSTVDDEGVTSDAMLRMEDVIDDLNHLNWREPCITSIQTLNAAVGCHQGPIHGGGSEGTVPSAASSQKRRRRIRKVGKGSFGKLVLKNWGPRKKRTSRRKNSVRSGVGVASSAGLPLLMFRECKLVSKTIRATIFSV